jgi:pyridoxine/pyridoxamine 5'-phosphate oxidase
MAIQTPTAERNLDRYGAPLIAWTRVRERLEQGFTQAPGTGGPSRHTCWLATIDEDNKPHVMPLGVLWLDGALYFNSGAGTRKAQNLARNPHCALTVATNEFDLVVEGDAVRVTDEAKLKRIADARTVVKDGSRPCGTAPSTLSTVRRAPGHPRGTCTK